MKILSNKKELDVIIIGAIGIDTNIYLTGKGIDFSIESNYTENVDYIGQAGGYASRGFAQLGYRTGLLDYIGDDHNGKYINFYINFIVVNHLLQAGIFSRINSLTINFLFVFLCMTILFLLNLISTPQFIISVNLNIVLVYLFIHISLTIL